MCKKDLFFFPKLFWQIFFLKNLFDTGKLLSQGLLGENFQSPAPSRNGYLGDVEGAGGRRKE